MNLRKAVTSVFSGQAKILEVERYNSLLLITFKLEDKIYRLRYWNGEWEDGVEYLGSGNYCS